MADLTLLVAVVVTVFGTATAQLFPFSSLRSYIDQHHSETVELTTKAPPPVDAYRYLHETRNQLYRTPNVGVEHRGTAVFDDEEKLETEQTVLVTPKPKYVPRRLVPEPNVDPNSPSIPSIGYGSGNGVFHRAQEPSSLPSISSPVRSVTIEKPSEAKNTHKFESKYEPIRLKEGSPKPYKTHYVEKTIVDSVPSLSVTIPLDGYSRKTGDGLLDYLTPPKFPSVYEDHMKMFSTSPVSNLIDSDVKQTTVVPVKTKKKKKNKNKVKSDSASSSTEKRVRVTTRTPSFKPNKGEPLEVHASGTEIYLRPSHKYRPPSISTPHPIEEQIAAETNFGLGSSSGGGERVEFQLHGQSGPDSYKFGFDTGDGKNRHFRYEEKDHTGNVKGHYGYYDKTGKLQVVNYHADKHGFHASSP